MKSSLAIIGLLVQLIFGQDVDEIVKIYAVSSNTANIPCDLTPPKEGDSARLVLWYKDSDPQPVYSFDTRYSKAKHWAEDPSFGSRSSFKDKEDPAFLQLTNVKMDDAGIYKCRIDFRKSPTAIKRVHLNIVEQPETPLIVDGDGSSVMGNLGPFRLGQPLILLCLVKGGKPRPKVIWYRDGMPFDDQSDPSTYPDILQNTLVISELDRTHHNSVLECKAINNNVRKAPRSRVRIVMETPILYMTMANLPDPVQADTEYEVLCQVIGSHPTPTVSWTIDGLALNSSVPLRISNQGNMSTSTLMFTPKIKDQGKTLTCHGEHQVFPSSNMTRLLNVYYPPIVYMEISNNVDPSNIVAGNEIVFNCLIRAHPWVWKILWYKDGEEVVPSPDVMIDEQTLRLKNVTKDSSGQYVCSAANVEGEGYSKPVMIVVNFRPICAHPQILHQEDGSGIDLLCHVDSKPKAFTYRWVFNSSETKFEIPSAERSMTFTNYRPGKGSDGQVVCWATNVLGESSQPCVFHVVPLETPHPPTQCEVTNNTQHSMEVTCDPGFDGGLDQHFVIEVYQTVNNTQVLVASNWTEEPVMSVWGLAPDSNYIVSIKSVNDKGESSPVFVGGTTGPGSMYLPISIDKARLPFLIVVVVILVLVLITGSFVTAACTIRYRKKGNSPGMSSIAHPDDITDETLAQFREAEAMLAQAELVQPDPPPRSSPNGIQRKVSFKDQSCPACTCGQIVRRGTSVSLSDRRTRCGSAANGSATLPLQPPNGNGSCGQYLPVERAVVKSFSIEKMRPICPVCNPSGNTPYPSDYPVHPEESGDNISSDDTRSSPKRPKSPNNTSSSSSPNTTSSSLSQRNNGSVVTNNNGHSQKESHLSRNGLKQPLLQETCTDIKFV